MFLDGLLQSVFSLSRDEVRALFSIEDWLVGLDIVTAQETAISDRKIRWREKWREGVFPQSFFGLIGIKPPDSEKAVIKMLNDLADGYKRLLVFCEALVFAPYYNIQSREATNLRDKVDEADRKRWRSNLLGLAEKARVSRVLLEDWEKAYAEALRGIGGRSDIWKKAALVALASAAFAVTGGVAAPAVGGLVGSLMGLSGAAAASAGLAFLGGGAIAGGGFGMAGGTVALIGGGALLGGVGGLAASRVFYVQHKVVLSQLAKLEATLKVIFKEHPDLAKILNETFEKLVASSVTIQMELKAPNLDPEERKRLEKTLEFYKEASRRLNALRLKIMGVS